MACCMVSDSADSDSPTPTAATVNTRSPRYSVTIDPAIGIWNQKRMISRMMVDCISPTITDGTALPTRICIGVSGVTSNWSKVPCSRSRATDSAASSSVCIRLSEAISVGIRDQRDSRFGLNQARHSICTPPVPEIPAACRSVWL